MTDYAAGEENVIEGYCAMHEPRGKVIDSILLALGRIKSSVDRQSGQWTLFKWGVPIAISIISLALALFCLYLAGITQQTAKDQAQSLRIQETMMLQMNDMNLGFSTYMSAHMQQSGYETKRIDDNEAGVASNAKIIEDHERRLIFIEKVR